MTTRDTMTPEQYAAQVQTIAAQAPPLKSTQTAALSALFDYVELHRDSRPPKTALATPLPTDEGEEKANEAQCHATH